MSRQATITSEVNISSINLMNKKNVLESTKEVLKKEFVGIDSIIDDVIHSIESWYIYPQGQMRPTVINLWGMTGVGKTSLIQRMSELLDIGNKLFRFDVGDYSSGDMKLKSEFSTKLKNNENQPVILMFDEFQLGRTISENGAEVDRNGLRALWDLLDTGKISIINENYYTSKIISLLIKLEYCIQNGVESSNGKITKNIKTHTGIFYNTIQKGRKTIIEEDGDGEGNVDPSLFVPNEYIYYIKTLSENPYLDTDSSIKSKLMRMDGAQVIEFLNDIISRNSKPVIHDYSQSVIFIIGNLDEVYSMAGVVDPDYNADTFYAHSIKITIPRVKGALKQRFRIEQIARLGNVHIIYPAFSSDSYKKLITMELDKFKKRVKDRYDFVVEFNESVNDIIYKEGVFPTQGTRPIFTTINVLIESYISKIVSDLILENLSADKIVWNFLDNESKYEITIVEKENKLTTKTYNLNLKLDNLRKSTKDNEQAHTAVHESGHALMACMYLGMAPEEVVSKTASTSDGYCRIKYPDTLTADFLKRDIAVGLGGYVAEEVVFGKKLLSNGSQTDIEMVTEKAISFIKTYGMNGFPILIGIESEKMNTSHYFENKESNKQIKEILKDSLKVTRKLIKKNKTLLLKMSEYLSENSRMDKDMVLNYVSKYGINPPLIKEVDDYYDFKVVLQKELKKNTIKKKHFNKKNV